MCFGEGMLLFSLFCFETCAWHETVFGSRAESMLLVCRDVPLTYVFVTE